MILKLAYEFKGNKDFIETTCSNYTFGLPKIFCLFNEKHGKSLSELEKSGEVADVVISSFYNDSWRVLERAYVKVKNKEVEFYNSKKENNH